jgi:ribosomal protein S18 acetylase RimI-like enzyme
LAEAIIREARAVGYAKMRLGTVPSMQRAVALYRSLGFQETEPYTVNPIPSALFLKLDLRK